MKREEYEKLTTSEDRMWWFRGLHMNLEATTALLAGRRRDRVIADVGCGTGGWLVKLAASRPGAEIVGLDLDEEACRVAREKSGRPVCVGTASRLPFATGSVDVMFSADVLCHEGVDELEVLRECHRCIAPAGLVVLNLPAYQWLFGAHDRAVSNVRRYTASRVSQLLRRAGFAEIRTTYWNAVLFPLMVAHRMVRPAASPSDVRPFSPTAERVFGGVMKFENSLIRRGIRLPFGGSVMAVARKA